MTSHDDLLNQLGAPFSYKDIEWRVQQTNEENTRGRAVPYLRFQAVATRLDNVLGALNWKNEYIPGPCGGVVCRISLRIGGEWIAKENGADNTSFEPIKGGLSDAFKRAAVMWNVGRYLYNAPPCVVDLDPDTRQMAAVPRLPAEMLPEGEREQYGIPAASAGDAAPAKPAPHSSAGEQSQEGEKVEATTQTATLAAAEGGGDKAEVVANGSSPDAAAPATARTNEAGNAGAVTLSEKDGLTLEDAMDSVPEGVDEENLKRIRTILTRSWDKADIRPSMRTYVKDRTKSKLPEQAVFYVLEILDRLDELDGVAAPV